MISNEGTKSVNTRWIFLLPLESRLLRTASVITCSTVSLRCMDVNHRQPIQAIFSQCCSTPSHEATKSRERPVTYIQEPTVNVRSSFKIT